MKVKELIEELQKLNPEHMVIVAGYEGGYDEVDNVGETRLILNVNTACYYGKHEIDKDGDTEAVVIS